MIIWLASFPRSGNSFFRVVSRNLFDREIYSIYDERMAPVTPEELNRMSQASETFLVKTHEQPADANPAIYLVRDGRDSLVSLTWFSLTSRSEPNRDISTKKFQLALKKEILSKKYGGWSQNILTWLHRPEKTVIVRFEDLISHPEEVVSKAFDAVGLVERGEARRKLPSFDELHARNPFLYRKGKVGGWKESMPEDLHELFWKEHKEGMDALGYKR